MRRVPTSERLLMKSLLPEELREATRLTKAGRLLEATAAIQRLLSPADPGGRTADASVTIDGEAEEIPDVGAAQTSKPSLLGRLRGYFEKQPAGEELSTPTGEAQHFSREFRNAAGARPYKLFIPSGYRGRSVPLIIMLHGCTQSADDFAAGTRMNDGAETNTCIVAYPEQIGAANPRKCWNWFKKGDQARESGEPSLIAGITQQVMREFAIDPHRVYVAGLSAGGAAAAVMGATYPDLFAAVGVHSGLPYGAAGDVNSAMMAMRAGGAGRRKQGTGVPTIVFHGDRDTVVNPLNAGYVVAQAAQGLELTEHVERGTSGGRAYTRTLYADGRGRTAVEQWTIHAAGHAWSGGSSKGSFTDPTGPNATKEMLRFFLQHQR
jgi:poly(hydroxyalkanoate) depolymerase family esterase